MAHRKAKDPQAEYDKLEEYTKRAAMEHAEADQKTQGRGWLCQCGSCRIVRTVLYNGAGNAERR